MKISDALRAAAESAPVDEIHVSTQGAARRVRRNRAVRAGANGIVGVGAVALVVAGIVNVVPAAPNTAAIATGDREANQDSGLSGGELAPVGPSGGSMLACGYEYSVAEPSGEVTATAEVTSITNETVAFDLDYTASSDGTFALTEPSAFILWQGLVVGNVGTSAGAQDWTAAAGDTLAVSADAKLVNCWDGKLLPAGDYTLVVVTPMTTAVDEPGDDAAVDPDTSVSSDTAGEVAWVNIEAVTDLTVAGDAVDNPFDDYLKGTGPNPVDPGLPAIPDDALSADDALAAYNAALTTGAWDMAAGTQRVVLTGSTTWTDDDWSKSYYGCAMDGLDGSFPSSSANLDWLDVTGSIPSHIKVSYGWVVDGNPQVSLSVTNTSPWSIPGFYGGASPYLALVKDGKIVAEAYPVSLDHGGPVAYAAEAREALIGGDAIEPIMAPIGNGYLASGSALSGEYLWRDVNGCWSGSSQLDIRPGTYTVLSSQNIYVGGYAYPMVDPAASTVAGDGASDKALTAPDQGAYASFQVWTSLGTVKVSN